MKLAYISGPYRGSSERMVFQNIMAAREVAMKYWARGYAVFCPHTNSMFMGGVISDKDFLAADLFFLEMCDTVVMLHNWKSSSGAVAEQLYAEARGKHIIYEGGEENA